MDKYRELRELALHTASECVGLTWDEAVGLCQLRELACRVLKVDGQGCMITADCRMDRIGLIINNGIVTETSCG